MVKRVIRIDYLEIMVVDSVSKVVIMRTARWPISQVV